MLSASFLLGRAGALLHKEWVFNVPLEVPDKEIHLSDQCQRDWSDRSQLWFTFSILTLIGVLWVATRPYRGIIDDARFYIVEALRILQPERFATDLYFRFGSQNNFTLFPKLYVPLIPIIGIGATAMVFTIAGQLLWLGGLFSFVTAFIRQRWRAVWGLAAVVALPSTYPLFGFGYGENFVTPRLFTEALTLIALGLLLRRNTWWALAILVLSVAFHPLIALPGVALAVLYLAVEQPYWRFAILGSLIAALALAFADIQPLSNLRHAYDPQWLSIVRIRDWMCFVFEWPASAYFRAVATLGLAVTALTFAEPRQHRFLGCTLAVGVGGLLCTIVGADLGDNVFFVQIQPWRAMWLLTLVSNLYAALIFLRLRVMPGAELTRLTFALALVALILTEFMAPVVFAAGPMIIFACCLAVWQIKAGRPPLGVARTLCFVALAVGCTATIILVFAYVWVTKEIGLRMTITYIALGAAALGLMLFLLRKTEPTVRSEVWPIVVSVGLAIVALFYWDARNPWTKFAESPISPPASLATFLPESGNVYWEGGVELLWMRLRRPNYYSCDQGTGALFFRGTALAYRARAEALWPLRTIDFGSFSVCPNLSDEVKLYRTRADLQAVCARDLALDDLVLIQPIEDADAKIWKSPVPFEYTRVVNGVMIPSRADRFYLYTCETFR